MPVRARQMLFLLHLYRVEFLKKRQLIGKLRRLLRISWRRALRIREQLHFTEETFHLVLAGAVGIIGGLVNVLTFYMVESVKTIFLRGPGDPVEIAEVMETWERVAIPTLGGFCAGLVLYWGLRLAGPQRSSNILEVVIAGDGRLPLRSAIIKFFSSMLTIGSGGSIGREGSITQLTATLASKWGQLAKWHPYRLRLLVGCGAASGISAAYNAPISGAVFAALIVLGNFSMSLFAPLVFASVIATMVSRSFFGIRPWYVVPPFDFTKLSQLPWFVVLGLIAGVLGAVFLKLLNRSEELFKQLRAPIYVRLVIGGLVVGLLAIYFPGVWGNGYIITNRILDGEYGSSAFSPRDLARATAFAALMRDPPSEDKLSSFLATRLSPETRATVSNYTVTPPVQLQRALAQELNRVIRSGPIFRPELFEAVTLQPGVQKLLDRQPQGEDLVRLNRLLLANAYPQEIELHYGSTPLWSLLFLAGLVLAKLLATLATVGSGAVGGVFTPTLFLGAGLGATFGLCLQQLGGGSGLPIPPFAVVGMGSLLAATTRSPLLAMIMIFEVSLDYSLMPALMLACVVSVLVSRRLHAESIYTEPLRHKGLMVSHEASTSEAATLKTVADIMRAPVTPVRETATMRELVDRFLTGANNFLPVIDAKQKMVGVVALQDLKEYLGAEDHSFAIIAYDVMRAPPPCVTPNQRLFDILPVVLSSELRNIPVVNTLTENRLVGALARSEVLSIFSEAIAASPKSGT
jgi:H+/Cl- antiporter ClcA/CBS domain-containing protein